MHDDRSAGALNDSSIEREIEAALAVDPSPEFLARVRARVASEPATAAWRPWALAACGAMAMMIVMVVVFSRSDQKTSPTRGDISLAPAPAIVPDQSLAAAPPPSRAREAPSPLGRVVRSRVSVRPTEPEVLASPGEAAALRRLLSGVRQRRVDLSLLGEGPPDSAELQPLNEIVIPPIAIEPLMHVARGEGVRQ